MAENKSDRQTYTTDFYTTDVDNVSFLGNSHIDNLTTSILAIGTEMWITRKRLHVLESLMKEKGITAEMIEKHEPTAEEKAAWQAEREIMAERLYAHFGETPKYTFTSKFEGK